MHDTLENSHNLMWTYYENTFDPRSKSALQSKYPARGRPMPLLVTKGHAVDSMMSLKEAFLKLKGGVAPGTGQLRPEFLVTLAEVWEEGEGDA